MIINTNVEAMNAHRQMGMNQQTQQSSMEKLSSGQQINRAGDDAAGLSISEKMRGQIRGLEQASSNAQDSISLIQTAEGALDETHDILQRMRELSVQSANDTNVEEDRDALQDEMDQLAEEVTRISENTEFNTQELLDDTFEGTFHIGANEGQNLDLAIGDMGAEALGVAGNASVTGEDIESFDLDGDNIEVELSVGGTEQTLSADEDYEDIDALVEDLNEQIEGGALDGEVTVDSDGDALVFNAANEGDDIEISSGNGDLSDLGLAPTSVDLGVETGGGELDGLLAANSSDDDVEINFTDLDDDTNNDPLAVNVDDDGTINVTFNNEEDHDLDDLYNALEEADTGDVSFNLGDNADTTAELTNALDNEEVDIGPTLDSGVSGGIDISTQESADAAITDVNEALETVSEQRSNLGAVQNRLEHTIDNLDNASENLSAAESRIRDTDMAEEMMEMTQADILNQASQSMLAQANQNPQNVLQLLQ
ncbi:flagellin [Salsuginibacillus halophilus]|uniref:Flagellin n=1 Tax=Salsuginibacillus halophilus TaxID=517424 RepID=A0A2P8HQS9_9BACI|nr:flagellin [Salsuginibacillus halophilus]PSL48578.1 flagellin [Salsuginibacillus halophilus]